MRLVGRGRGGGGVGCEGGEMGAKGTIRLVVLIHIFSPTKLVTLITLDLHSYNET